VADLLSLVNAAEVTYGDHVAVSDRDLSLSFTAVARRSTRAAHLLRSLHGDDPGLVALLIGNRIEAVELDVALVKAGLGRVSLNPRLAEDELRFILADSRARVMVCAPEYAALAGEMAAADPDLRCLVVDERIPAGLLGYEDELARASSAPATQRVVGDDPSLVMYTSGTTGRPKGAVWSFASRAAAVRNMLVNELDRAAARRMIHVGSLSHGSGSKVLPVYLRGGENLILDRFDPEDFLETADRTCATATFIVPTMIQMLVDTATATGHRLDSMRHIAYGGAKMPLPTIESALELFGDRFVQVYGSCEAPHPILLLDQEAHATRDPRILATAGRPSIGVDVRIGDGLAAPGAQGEIIVRSPSLFTGYWQDDVATGAVVVDGAFHTGDVGRVHDDGYVEVIDRIKDLIISGGYNVYPAEVERVLLEHPDVAQASVYGLPDERWGETVGASIVCRSGASADPDQLAAFCGARLAGYKKPPTFQFLETFPLGTNGKVLTAELRRLHQGTRTT
jgi:acyl-CoA synthetase (AMP-forming)/AMP-acid ligase II